MMQHGELLRCPGVFDSLKALLQVRRRPWAAARRCGGGAEQGPRILTAHHSILA